MLMLIQTIQLLDILKDLFRRSTKVFKHADAFIDGMHAYNIITTIKHFPGHGSSKDDSHLGLTDITQTYNKELELSPYKNLIKKIK